MIPLMESKSDAELITKYLKGDEASLRILIERYLASVYRFVRGYVKNDSDAEDITQETFVRAWRNFHTFDHEKSFKTWIFAIAKHASIDALKKKKAINFSLFDNEDGDNILSEMLMDTGLLPDEILEKKVLPKCSPAWYACSLPRTSAYLIFAIKMTLLSQIYPRHYMSRLIRSRAAIGGRFLRLRRYCMASIPDEPTL